AVRWCRGCGIRSPARHGVRARGARRLGSHHDQRRRRSRHFLSRLRARPVATGATGMTDKIYLVGFMACGKTTTSRMLAAKLGWRAEDIDDLIEARERRTIAEIFARQGEPYFRAVERDLLALLRPMREVVVATGGGTFSDPENRAAINRDGISVWLDVPL